MCIRDRIIHANIEHLAVGDSISISDLDLPEGVTPTLAGDVLVAIVNESRVTKSEEAEEGGEETEEAPAEAPAEEAAAK